MIQVYKFGGASIATPERMEALLPIIGQAEKPLAVVVSAFGKTTNALETIVKAVLNQDAGGAKVLAGNLEQAHRHYARALLSEEAFKTCEPKLCSFIEDMHEHMEDTVGRPADYVYDQIVSTGELLSSTILAAFLNDRGVKTQWKDARTFLRTDDHYRDAKVDEVITRSQIKEKVLPSLESGTVVVTQGFIGSTAYHTATTLGREGSDYSGALLAAMLPAASLSIWKDVEGLMNADPRKFPEAERMAEITFHEVIEMAYYGAQVIHPKTIKPLQNADIPLRVKCFLDPSLPGTLIHNTGRKLVYPPLIVLKEEQTLLQITSRDFSFITEGNLSRLYHIFHQYRMKINLIQHAAISVVFVVDQDKEKIQTLTGDLEQDYEVLRNDHQQLLTIRHYSAALVDRLTAGKEIILTQRARNTIQMVLNEPVQA